MGKRFFSTACVLIYLILTTTANGAEVRTYSFVGDAPAYRFSCGECSGPPYTLRGQISGSFAVSLDFAQGVGTLTDLDVHVNNAEGQFGIGNWQPINWTPDFFGPGILGDFYRPPLSGVLTPATYRPLGPGTLTQEHMAPYIGVRAADIPAEINYYLDLGIGFEPAPANAWLLSAGGSMIYLEGDRALFSYVLPIFDAQPALVAASAKLLVPEPCAAGLMCCALGWLVCRRGRGRARVDRARGN